MLQSTVMTTQSLPCSKIYCERWWYALDYKAPGPPIIQRLIRSMLRHSFRALPTAAANYFARRISRNFGPRHTQTKASTD
jgi:hypothetical protein